VAKSRQGKIAHLDFLADLRHSRVKLTALALLICTLVIYIKFIRDRIRFEREHPCIRSHVVKEWVPPYWTYGFQRTIVVHPGHYEDYGVCDERK
jgi:hypothetical protein